MIQMTMKNLYDEINNPDVRRDYYEGRLNKVVRTYWYLDLGLELVNKFKYIVAGILALAVILQVENSLKWIVTIFFIALPILTVAGYLWARFGVRVVEYLDLKLATHFGQYSIKLQEKQLEVMEDLTREIKKLNENNNSQKN